ncbi:MAG: alpha/beta hydrolase [Polyangia bacterium]|jgi:alpha/beta superfamily hydrolase
MLRASETVLVDGPAGPVQTLIDEPETLRGLALVAHPHPLFGGANNNKVVYTLAHCLRDFGYLALRPNFRGVGKSAGVHDHGEGETEDLLAVLDYAIGLRDASHALPVLLAGYSFGAFVQTRVAQRLAGGGRPAEQLILVAIATGQVEGNRYYRPEPVPRGSLLIHGGRDTTVPLANVLAFAEPSDLPVTVIPGADHFFHGRLAVLREIVERDLRSRVL